LLKIFYKLAILIILVYLIGKILKVLKVIIITKLKLKSKAIDKQQLEIFVLTIILSKLLIDRAISTNIICINKSIIVCIRRSRSYLLLNVRFFVKQF